MRGMAQWPVPPHAAAFPRKARRGGGLGFAGTSTHAVARVVRRLHAGRRKPAREGARVTPADLPVAFFASLDVRTLLRLMFIADVVVCLLLLGYRAPDVRRVLVRRFVAARSMHGVACLLISFRGDIPAPASVLAANVMLLFGFALEASAIVRLRGRVRHLDAVFFLIAAAGSLAFGILPSTPAGYVGVASLAISALFGFGCVVLAAEAGRSRLQWIMASFYLTVAVTFLLRSYAGFFSGLSVMASHPLQISGLVVMYLNCIGGGVGFLLLMKEDADRLLLVAATTDPLTGILNRRAYLDAARGMLDGAAREGIHVSMLLMDIDHFKSVNDTFGHPAGDALLVEFTARMRAQLEPADVFGRVGGEEFAVLLLGGTDAVSAIAGRLLCTAHDVAVTAAAGHRCTVSIGCATVASRGRKDLDDLFRRCDGALYAAKRAGRDRLVVV